MTDDTMPASVAECAEIWRMAKEQEEAATTRRRKVEDHIRKLAGKLADFEGTETVEAADYVIKMSGRTDYKVDGDKLQDIAAENGLTSHLSSLFRWKPELNMTAWKACDPSISKPLAEAITSKPGRPTFKITTKE